MYLFFREFHSTVAYVLITGLLLVIIYLFYAWIAGKPFTKKQKIIAMLGMVVAQIQFSIGLVLYFLSPLGSSNFNGEAMKNSISRLFILEHPLMMLLGMVLISFGYAKAKRVTSDKLKYKYSVIFYGLGFVFILSRIPWEMWL